MVAGQEGAYRAAVDRSGELERFQGIRKFIPGGHRECTRVPSGHSQPGIRGEASRSLQSAEVLGALIGVAAPRSASDTSSALAGDRAHRRVAVAPDSWSLCCSCSGRAGDRRKAGLWMKRLVCMVRSRNEARNCLGGKGTLSSRPRGMKGRKTVSTESNWPIYSLKLKRR